MEDFELNAPILDKQNKESKLMPISELQEKKFWQRKLLNNYSMFNLYYWKSHFKRK